MKPTATLINDLRNEYLGVQQKIAAASFALDTINLDEMEYQLLNSQIDDMCEYAAKIKARAKYAADKDRNNIKNPKPKKGA